MSQYLRWRILVMLIVGSLGACTESRAEPAAQTSTVRSALLAPTTFQEQDLVGHWQNSFTKYTTEDLLLTADHRFVQLFETRQRHYKGQGTWSIEQRPSGCVYVHLEGMLYFYASEAFERYGNRFTPNGPPYSFWDRCEEQRIPMPGKVILTVSDLSRWPRGIGLELPATGNLEGSGVQYTLIADAAGQLIPSVIHPYP
jgi:hypothetical protein